MEKDKGKALRVRGLRALRLRPSSRRRRLAKGEGGGSLFLAHLQRVLSRMYGVRSLPAREAKREAKKVRHRTMTICQKRHNRISLLTTAKDATRCRVFRFLPLSASQRKRIVLKRLSHFMLSGLAEEFLLFFRQVCDGRGACRQTFRHAETRGVCAVSTFETLRTGREDTKNRRGKGSAASDISGFR